MQNYLVRKLHLPAFVYFVLCFIVLIVDYIRLYIYYYPKLAIFLKLNEFLSKALLITTLALILLAIIGSLFFLISRYRSQIRESFYLAKLGKVDWLMIGLLLVLTFLRLPIPDWSFDTLNYHLYLQNPGPLDNISHNFFPSNIQTYTFPLPDRIYYYFRALLGFRAGVILNTLVLIVILLQIKDILLRNKDISKSTQTRPYLLGIGALAIISTEFILGNIGIYMVDILPLPFLLEIFRYMVMEKKHSPNFVFPYIALLAGFSVSMKFSMIIFCLPEILVLMYRYRKELPFRQIFVISALFVFPLIPYMVYNFAQTGNPIFPYFNSIFRSPYFPLSNFKDLRWGPKNFTETLLWPILIFFQPNRTAELPYYSGRLGIGYIGCLFFLFDGLKNKNNRMIWISFAFLTSTILWVISTGYVRYGAYIEVLAGLIIFEMLITLISSEKRVRIASSGIVLTFFAIQLFLGYSYTLNNKTDWSERPTIFKNPQFYWENLKYIFNDFQPVINTGGSQEINEVLGTVDFWMVLPGEFNSGIDNNVVRDAPIISMGYINTSEYTSQYFSQYKSAHNLTQKNKFCITTKKLEEIPGLIDPLGYQISDVYSIQLKIYDSRRPLWLIRLVDK